MAKFSGGSGYGRNPFAAFVEEPTHEGGRGYVRAPRQELFLLAASEMAEDTYYENAEERRVRLAGLIGLVLAEKDGFAWVVQLVKWLRESGMRSVSVMVAAECVALGGGAGGGARQLVSSACARGDEPAEFLGYWLQYHGRKIPAAVKRGIADAAVHLYSERNALRYDGAGRAIRMADVIELTHPSPQSGSQSVLFKHLLDDRHGRGEEVPTALPALSARERLVALSPDQRHAFMRRVQAGDEAASAEFELALAGQWEFAKSWLGQK